MKISLLLSALIVLLILIGCDEDLVKPENHNPVILSLTVFPEVVNPNDSLIIICNAMDPDADTLVYDWYTFGLVRIKGYDHPALFNTKSNSQIFYAPDSQYVLAPQDTFWIECAARDRKGGQVSELINFIVKQDSTGSLSASTF